MSREKRLRRLAAQGLAEAERGVRELERAVEHPARRHQLAHDRGALDAYEQLVKRLLSLDKGQLLRGVEREVEKRATTRGGKNDTRFVRFLPSPQ